MDPRAAPRRVCFDVISPPYRYRYLASRWQTASLTFISWRAAPPNGEKPSFFSGSAHPPRFEIQTYHIVHEITQKSAFTTAPRSFKSDARLERIK